MADDRHDQAEHRPLVGVEPQVATSAATTTMLRVAVTNAALEPRVLAVSAIGIDPSWVDGTQHTETLAPGGSAVVEFRVTPPVGTLPAKYPLVIAAQPLDPASGRPTSPVAGTAETVLVVDPRTQLAIDLEPRELRMVGSRRFKVLVSNGGVTPAKVNLLLQAGSQVSFQLGQQVEVAPGTTATVRGRARVRRPQMLGGRITHPFTITARGTESVKHVDGQVVQKSAVGPSALKGLVLLLVLAVWAGAAIVFIPALAREVRSTSEEKAAAAAPGADDAGEEGAADPGAGGEDDGDGEGGGDGAGGAGGDEGADEKKGLQLSGTVGGDAPAGVTVRMEPTSLVDEEAQGGIGVGVPGDALSGSGKSMAAAFLRPVARRQEQPRSVTTADDGSWAFPSVRSPGYYLVTFTKTGYQTQRFVVDSSSAAAAEPLEVEIAPGEGSLSGVITGPNGQPVGDASVTITDGTNTISTSTNSDGQRIGAWSIGGLSSPSTYVVMATRHGMSSEARTIDLAAGGSATADLRLVDGVATLFGQVHGPVRDKDDAGLGGITVTVSDSDGKVRTATTLTQSPRGYFSMPSLPTPGTYSVTVTGAGYQSQTTSVTLRAGQAEKELDVSLRPSTGQLGGQVKALRPGKKPVGLENAGMTLSNAEHTYKTTSTRSNGLGSYDFTGIAPGTYTLTTRYFGLTTDTSNVTIDAGLDDDPFDIVLVEEEGSGLPATSTVTGSVIDAQTGQEIDTCAELDEDVFEPCLTASVDDAGVVRGGKEGTADPHTTTFAPNEEYELPDPDATPAKGLRPGLHTVTLTAPGYEVGTVDVEVGQNGEVEAPLAQLFRAPRITGSIDHAVSDEEAPTAPDALSCVWVFPGVVNPSGVVGRDSCKTARTGSNPVCKPGQLPYDGTPDPAVDEWCATTDGTGRYSVQVPQAGTYTLWIQPDSNEYVARDPLPITLDHGAVSEQNRVLDRYGQVLITVVAPDEDGDLSPVNGVQVTSSSPPAVTPILPTATEAGQPGRTRVFGLSNDRDYRFSAAVTVDTLPDEDGGESVVKGSVTQTVPYNTIRILTLRLTEEVAGFQGRVTSSLDGTVVDDADVLVKAVRSYDSGDLPDYGTDISVHTDRLGCFAIKSKEIPTRSGACVADDDLTGTSWPVNGAGHATLAERAISTNRARSIVISAEDYETRTWTDHQFATSGLTKLALNPAPVDLGSILATVKTDAGPAGAAPAWAGASVTVSGGPTNAGTITARLAASGDPRVGVLSWRDSSIAGSPLGKIRPGQYTVRVTGVTGLEPGTGVLVCATGATSCAWKTGAGLELTRQGRISVTVRGVGGALITDADLTLKKVGSSSTSSGDTTDGSATFANIAPAVGTTDYSFDVRAGGYDWDVTGSAAVQLACGLPNGAMTIKAGETTACTITLTRKLASLSGTLKGVLNAEGGSTTSYEALGGFEVRLRKCTTVACTAFDTAFPTLSRTTPLATTDGTGAVIDEGGRFTFGGSVGQPGVPDVEGLFPDTHYLLTVPDLPQGFSYPSGRPDGGTVVSIPASGADQTAGHALLYANRVSFDVHVFDQHGKPVTDATVRVNRDANAAPNDPGDLVDDSGTPGGRYSFGNALPGIWYIWVSAPGLTVTGAAEQIVNSSASGGGQVVDVEVRRAGAQVSGAVTTNESGSPVALGEVSVSLVCAAGTSLPGDRCRGDQPALGTDGRALEMTTAGSATGGLPAGGYLFSAVPAGTFDLVFSKRGYGRTEVPLTITDRSNAVRNQTLAPIVRDVRVTIRPSHASPATNFASTSVTLRPRTGTIAPQQVVPTLTPAGGGAWTATFNGVRWGCWEVVVKMPDDHHGTIGALEGSPTQPGLTCADGDLLVPDAASEDPVDVGVRIAEGFVEYDVTPVTWRNHLPPTASLVLTDEDGVERVLPGLSGGAWIAPGPYEVSVRLPDAQAPYWTVPAPYVVTVPPGGDSLSADVDLTITEKDFAVIVSIPSLPDGETGYLLVSPGLGQTGTYPNRATDPSDDLRVPVQVIDGRKVTLRLPRGKWLIEGSWSTGPDADVVDVAGSTTPYTIQLGPSA